MRAIGGEHLPASWVVKHGDGVYLLTAEAKAAADAARQFVNRCAPLRQKGDKNVAPVLNRVVGGEGASMGEAFMHHFLKEKLEMDGPPATMRVHQTLLMENKMLRKLVKLMRENK